MRRAHGEHGIGTDASIPSHIENVASATTSRSTLAGASADRTGRPSRAASASSTRRSCSPPCARRSRSCATSWPAAAAAGPRRAHAIQMFAAKFAYFTNNLAGVQALFDAVFDERPEGDKAGPSPATGRRRSTCSSGAGASSRRRRRSSCSCAPGAVASLNGARACRSELLRYARVTGPGPHRTDVAYRSARAASTSWPAARLGVISELFRCQVASTWPSEVATSSFDTGGVGVDGARRAPRRRGGGMGRRSAVALPRCPCRRPPGAQRVSRRAGRAAHLWQRGAGVAVWNRDAPGQRRVRASYRPRPVFVGTFHASVASVVIAGDRLRLTIAKGESRWTRARALARGRRPTPCEGASRRSGRRSHRPSGAAAAAEGSPAGVEARGGAVVAKGRRDECFLLLSNFGQDSKSHRVVEI